MAIGEAFEVLGAIFEFLEHLGRALLLAFSPKRRQAFGADFRAAHWPRRTLMIIEVALAFGISIGGAYLIISLATGV